MSGRFNKCTSCSQALLPEWHFCPFCSEGVPHSTLSKLAGWTSEKIDHLLKNNLAPNVASSNLVGAGSYGSGVRAQVIEVIVRQGMAGAPWRMICATPMRENNIDPREIEDEINRRLISIGKTPFPPDEPDSTADFAGAFAMPTASQHLARIRESLNLLGKTSQDNNFQDALGEIIGQLDVLDKSIYGLEHASRNAESEARLQNDLERENARVRKSSWTPGNL